jgi:hypothetical protein
MDISMGGFAAYELINLHTGIALYRTCATTAEIIQANANLRARSYDMRYFEAGTFTVPDLHHPAQTLRPAL